MNDLAEQTLRGLDAAGRQVRGHALIALGTGGAAVSVLVVLAGARAGAGRDTRPLTSWLGTQVVHGVPAESRVPAALLFGGLVALALLWVVAVEVVRRSGPPSAHVWRLAAAWAAPFAIGPPLLDTSVYSYVAYGRLQREGHDPYVASPSRLGGSAIVTAVDPGQRGTPSADGPLGTLLTHLSTSVASGTLVGTTLALRVLCVLAAIAACRAVAELAGPQRAVALALSAANPLVLLFAVSAPHLEIVMLAFALNAALAAHRRRWLPAVLLAAVAGGVAAQGLVAVPIVIVAHVRTRRRGRRRRAAVRDVAAAAAVVGLTRLVQPDGFGWVRTVDRQFGQQTPFSVTGVTGKLLGLIVRGASYDDLAAGSRLTAAVAATCVIAYLAVTAHARAVAASIGGALLALALLAPELRPWYLMWGTLALVPGAPVARRYWLLALGAAGCVLTPIGFDDREAAWLTAAALAVIAATLAVALRRTLPTPGPAPAPAAPAPAAPSPIGEPGRDAISGAAAPAAPRDPAPS